MVGAPFNGDGIPRMDRVWCMVGGILSISLPHKDARRYLRNLRGEEKCGGVLHHRRIFRSAVCTGYRGTHKVAGKQLTGVSEIRECRARMGRKEFVGRD
jgi:hypothetical protein